METFSKNGFCRIVSCIIVLLFAFHKGMSQPEGSISFETFYYELEPYGTWVEDVDYGYVWIPDVPRDFHPYVTDGHWVMTDYGNTWVSHYEWGWAPFHYGRWRYDNYYGWMWIPGTEWSPAWVAWRSGGGYYGWAPLGPGLHINISVNIGHYIPDHHWVFVRHGYITRRRVYNYCVPRRNVVNIIHHTTIINHTNVYNNTYTYYTGPRTWDIERATRQRVQVHRIQQVGRPGTTVVRNGAVSVYRPSVEKTRGNFVPASSRTRGNKAHQKSVHSERSYTNRKQESASTGDGRVYGRQSQQKADDNTRSYRSNAPSQRGNNTSNRTSGSSPSNSMNKSKDHVYTRGSSRDHASSRSNGSSTTRTRESYSNRSSNSTNNTDRSTRTVTPDNRAVPQRKDTYDRGQSQRRQSSVKDAGASRKAAGQPASRANEHRKSSRSGLQR